jgi:heat-inducible transcriptional repressor
LRTLGAVLTPRQEQILARVVEGYLEEGQPVGSKAIAADPELGVKPSTVRNELAMLEEQGLLTHPHTSAGRVPTDAGYRYFVDRLLPERKAGVELELMRREVDDAMRVAAETLSQVTSLLAIVSAPPIETATIRHVEVLQLQPQVVMVVTITSTGGVAKRLFTFDRPMDSGLVAWAGEYLNERLVGLGLGMRTLHHHLTDPTLPPTERGFLEALAPAFTELAATAGSSLFVDGAARLLTEQRFHELPQINELMQMLERRVELLGALASALAAPDVLVRIGQENEVPQLRSWALVAAGYGLPGRPLGAVSVLGPVRMDYGVAIPTVREAAHQLSRFVADVYEDS